MVIVSNEDLWEELEVASIIFVTTNSFTNRQGELIMGAGAAKEAADRFHKLPYIFGKILRDRKKTKNVFGIMDTSEIYFTDSHGNKAPYLVGTQIGAFQTKTNPAASADIEVIKQSTRMLKFWADKWERIALNFPGIGLGKLDEKDVMPIIETLPDNVYIYKKDVVVQTNLHPVYTFERKNKLTPKQRGMSENDFHRR